MKNNSKGLIVATFLVAVLALSMSVSYVKGQPFTGTQLAMVLNGSGSIGSAEWTVMIDGLANATRDCLPHDGSVELTVVQFGTGGPAWAWTAVSPTVLTAATVPGVVSTIQGMSQPGGNTPMADGVFLGWKEISGSPNFATATKQVINLGTDGMANERNYNATVDLDGDADVDAMDDVIAARNIALAGGLDEFDAEGIGISDTYRDWLRDYVVYPQPGYIAPPFTDGGWVRVVADADEFAATICEKFEEIIPPEPVGGFRIITPLDTLKHLGPWIGIALIATAFIAVSLKIRKEKR